MELEMIFDKTTKANDKLNWATDHVNGPHVKQSTPTISAIHANARLQKCLISEYSVCPMWSAEMSCSHRVNCRYRRQVKNCNTRFARQKITTSKISTMSRRRLESRDSSSSPQLKRVSWHSQFRVYPRGKRLSWSSKSGSFWSRIVWLKKL